MSDKILDQYESVLSARADALLAEIDGVIDLSKLTQVSYCILVLWLKGHKVLEIARALRISEGSVQHPIRERKNGGYLPKARKDMSLAERQQLLEQLKSRRLDDGLLPDSMFRAI